MCRFDLTLEMTHDSAKDEVVGHIEYRTDLFKRTTIEALVNHFAVSLTHVSWRVAVSASLFEQPGLEMRFQWERNGVLLRQVSSQSISRCDMTIARLLRSLHDCLVCFLGQLC